MNDFDNQPDATAEFDADAAENYIADAAGAAPDAIELSDEETEARARLMRANLDQFDLDEEDLALLAGESAHADSDDVAAGLPVLAVVGRPNVGKSTLVNRILGRREAVVQDTPGVTRDRVSYPAEWAGRDFTLVDTGGWEIDVKGLDRSVAEQAEIAVDLADAVVLVLDATVGVTASDERIVEMLRAKKKPIILAANKVDSPLQEADAAYLWSLGLGEPHPISALHGRGTGDLLDVVMEVLPTESAVASALPSGGPRRVALVGRPNVGKSSLMNGLLRESRAIVTDMPGTTRDTIEEAISIKNIPVYLTDTAGIRETTDTIEQIGIEKTKEAFNSADFIIFILDGSEELTEEDRLIMEYIGERNALVLINKNDLGQKIDAHEIRDAMPGVRVIQTSLIKGEGITEIEDTIEELVYGGRISQKESLMVNNVRHIELLNRAADSLRDAYNMADAGEALDFIEVDVKNAYELLGEITGETVSDDIINEVFSRFCLGK